MTVASGPIGNGPIGSSGGANYVLNATSGTFTLSMRGAAKLISDVYPSGTFTLSGQPTLNPVAYAFEAQSGAFTLTGNNASGALGKGIFFDPVTFATTGHAVTMQKHLSPDAAVGVFSLTGQVQTYEIHVSYILDPTAFILTGQDAGVTAQFKMTVTHGAFASTGHDVETTAQLKMQALVAEAYSLEGYEVKFRGFFSPVIPPETWTDAA
tara:strand:+ start:3116 stop:3745 length:630 start_codon:yes stop_codon:yes gene_type:complete